MKIKACQRCSSTNLDEAFPRSEDSTLGQKICRECGWSGTPFEFGTEKDYKGFQAGIQINNKLRDSSHNDKFSNYTPEYKKLTEKSWSLVAIFLMGFVILLGIIAALGTLYYYSGLSIEIYLFLVFLSLFISISYIWKRWKKRKG